MTTQLLDDPGACYYSPVGKLQSVHTSWLTL